MAKQRKTSTDQFRAVVRPALKQEVNQIASDLIENVLKAKHVEPPPKEAKFNYLVDITTQKCLIRLARSPRRRGSS